MKNLLDSIWSSSEAKPYRKPEPQSLAQTLGKHPNPSERLEFLTLEDLSILRIVWEQARLA